MKNILTIVFITILPIQVFYAQKAKDILENGILVKSGKIIVLKYDTDAKDLRYDIARSFQNKNHPLNFTLLRDSTIFLGSKDGMNLYLKPLNPLNYSYSTKTEVIADPVNEEAASAVGIVVDVFKTTLKLFSSTKSNGVTALPDASYDTCETFHTIETNLKKIKELLENDEKISINEVFTELKTIQFSDSATVNKQLRNSASQKLKIENSYSSKEALISSTKKMIEEYTCEKSSAFITKYLFTFIFKDLFHVYEEQKKRLLSLQLAYSMVEKASRQAQVGGGEPGLYWCFKLSEVTLTKGKVAVYTITIKESGLKLSERGEIVAFEEKNSLKRAIRIKRFNRFVPEVSAGLAYTFFKYNTYGTSTDATGQQIVIASSQKIIRGFNVTTMVNCNWFISHSNVNPLWQVGIGITEVPTLVLGLGLRGIFGTSRMTFSGGIAMPWVKELDKLKIGDKVTGTSEIESDLKYQFLWPPKLYIGLQFNF